jgi:hypothetical protein
MTSYLKRSALHLSVIFGILFWITDSALDSLYKTHQVLIRFFFIDHPDYEFVWRVLSIVLIISLGFMATQYFRLKDAVRDNPGNRRESENGSGYKSSSYGDTKLQYNFLRQHILSIGVAAGMLFWITDAVLDSIYKPHLRWAKYFLMDQPIHEFYWRNLVLLLFISVAFLTHQCFRLNAESTHGYASLLPAKSTPWHHPIAKDFKLPIFVVGTMRSGTTLLADLLGRHREIIHCPFELKDVWSKIGGIPMASAKTKDRYCYQMRAEDASLEQSRLLMGAFRKEWMKKRRGKSEFAYFLNKNPHLCNKLPFVNELFPEARFLFIRRGLLQVVASLKRLLTGVYKRRGTLHYWPEVGPETTCRCWMAFHKGEQMPADINMGRIFPGGDVGFFAEYWFESNLAISEFHSLIGPDRSLLIEEEELIASRDAELAKCLAFLGVGPWPKRKVLPDLDKNRNEQWRSLLSENEINSVVRVIRDRIDQIDRIYRAEMRARAYRNQLLDLVAEKGRC